MAANCEWFSVALIALLWRGVGKTKKKNEYIYLFPSAMGSAILWAWERKQSLSTFTYCPIMRAFTAYLAFSIAALSITTYTLDGLAVGVREIAEQRNSQIEAILSR